eukprot:g71944.t1
MCGSRWWSNAGELLVQLEKCKVWKPWFPISSSLQLVLCIWLLLYLLRARVRERKRSDSSHDHEGRGTESHVSGSDHPQSAGPHGTPVRSGGGGASSGYVSGSRAADLMDAWTVLFSVTGVAMAIVRLALDIRVHQKYLGYNLLFAFNVSSFWIVMTLFLFKYVQVTLKLVSKRSRKGHRRRDTTVIRRHVHRDAGAFSSVTGKLACLVFFFCVLAPLATFLGLVVPIYTELSFSTTFWSIFLIVVIPMYLAFMFYVHQVKSIVQTQLGPFSTTESAVPLSSQILPQYCLFF